MFILLDTNILQWMEVQGEAVFDGFFHPEEEKKLLEDHGPKALAELRALRDIIWVAQRGSLPIAVSTESVREFVRTREPEKKRALVSWAMEMLDWWEQNREGLVDSRVDVAKVQREILHSGKLSFLPDDEDRLLVSEAISLGCDTFLTLDRKTILRHHDKLTKLGIDALSPREFVHKYRYAIAGA